MDRLRLDKWNSEKATSSSCWRLESKSPIWGIQFRAQDWKEVREAWIDWHWLASWINGIQKRPRRSEAFSCRRLESESPVWGTLLTAGARSKFGKSLRGVRGNWDCFSLISTSLNRQYHTIFCLIYCRYIHTWWVSEVKNLLPAVWHSLLRN